MVRNLNDVEKGMRKRRRSEEAKELKEQKKFSKDLEFAVSHLEAGLDSQIDKGDITESGSVYFSRECRKIYASDSWEEWERKDDGYSKRVYWFLDKEENIELVEKKLFDVYSLHGWKDVKVKSGYGNSRSSTGSYSWGYEASLHREKLKMLCSPRIGMCS